MPPGIWGVSPSESHKAPENMGRVLGAQSVMARRMVEDQPYCHGSA